MKLKELRVLNNKTQQEVAEKINITQFTYSNYETGKTKPTIEILIKLADYYNVTLDYLLNRPFVNEFGYMTSEEKLLMSNFRKLNTYNQGKIIGEVAGLLMSQN